MKLFAFVNDFIKSYFNKDVYVKTFVGFSCGLPAMLRLSVLDIWLKDCGVSNAMIGFFSLLHWPYWFKFLWAPFIERIDFPYLSKKFGRRRGWAIASQCLLFIGIFGMACCNPEASLGTLLIFASLTAFADGCQDVSMYAYQLDGMRNRTMGVSAGVFIFGYRMGMFFAKSLTLYLAHFLDWNSAYHVMAFAVFLCTVFVLGLHEPVIDNQEEEEHLNELAKNYIAGDSPLGEIKRRIYECLICPFKLFMEQDGWKISLALIFTYRIGDRILQKMSKLFYVDVGFSLLNIANAVQVFGTIATIAGGLIGGYYVKCAGIKKSMFYLGIIHGLASFSYIALTRTGANLPTLYFTVFIENTTGGALTTTFIAYLYSLCNHRAYPATQYALLWAFYELGGMVCRSISGAMADCLGWLWFFAVVPMLFVPGLLILWKMLQEEKCLSANASSE